MEERDRRWVLDKFDQLNEGLGRAEVAAGAFAVVLANLGRLARRAAPADFEELLQVQRAELEQLLSGELAEAHDQHLAIQTEVVTILEQAAAID